MLSFRYFACVLDCLGQKDISGFVACFFSSSATLEGNDLSFLSCLEEIIVAILNCSELLTVIWEHLLLYAMRLTTYFYLFW